MSDRFELEQAILSAWGTADDVKLVIGHVLEDANTTPDSIANALIGIETLHELRMKKVFSLFERMVAQRKIL